MVENMKKNIKIVNLRALAILLVVLGHSIIIYSPQWGYYTTENKVLVFQYLKDIINIIQMPIFFSISGYLFCKSINSKRNIIEFVKNKIKRLLIPFILIGIAWMIPIKYIINYYKEGHLPTIFIKFILGIDIGHLWYLIALFLIFMIFYLIRKQIEKTTIKKDILISMILLIISLMASKYFIHKYINDTLIYLFYFYIGILIRRYEDNINWNKTLISIISILLMILSILVKSEILKYITAIITTITLYKIMPNKTTKLVEKISSNCFGIYLFHSPLIYITFTYFANSNPLLILIINFFIFGTISFYLTELVRKIKLELIIGE